MRLFTFVAVTITLCTWAVANPIPNPGFEDLEGDWAAKWGRYNWGPEDSRGAQAIDTAVAHSGKHSLQGINQSSTAAGGAYTHVPLDKGPWALTFWAKAAPGEVALVRCYLATSYSRSYEITDQWTKITYVNELLAPIERAEINVQNATRRPCTIWVDDISLAPSKVGAYQVLPDRRPLSQQPKALYFDGHLQYWADHAAEWKARGFSGVFCSYIYGDMKDDPWAADKDPATRGEADKLMQECRAANAKCRAAGIDCNVLKVAFYTDLPDPFEDAAWARLTRNCREAAKFARLAGFAGFAIDTEYTAYQFDPDWKGWDRQAHSAEERGVKLQERWAKITESICREYPEVEFMTLPEGAVHYGPYWSSIFAGMIEGLQRRNHTQGIHVFTEATYQMRDPRRLRDFLADVQTTTARGLPAAQREWWLKYGTVALGAWPLGYYRAITDQEGKFLGWSGRQETFGDRLVGSYADKSSNYPVAEFRPQWAAMRTLSGKYCWIYGHGSSWWQMTEAEAEHYKATTQQHFPRDNYIIKTAPDVATYYQVTAGRDTMRWFD